MEGSYNLINFDNSSIIQLTMTSMSVNLAVSSENSQVKTFEVTLKGGCELQVCKLTNRSGKAIQLLTVINNVISFEFIVSTFFLSHSDINILFLISPAVG